MKYFILLVFLLIFALGCSHGLVTPESNTPVLPNGITECPGNTWTWGSYTIAISEDRSQAELIPVRNSSLHLNVNTFVEGPLCPDCLMIGKPQPQGDGTFKLKVWLRHAFEEDRPLALSQQFKLLKNLGFRELKLLWQFNNEVTYLAEK